MAARLPDVPQFAETNHLEIPSAPLYQELCHLVAVEKNIRALEDIRPTGVAIDPTTSRIYIAEGMTSCVSIFSDSGEFIEAFSHEYSSTSYLWGIAIHGDNIYVTDTLRHYLLQFEVAAGHRFVAKVGFKGSKTGEFDYPAGLTVSSNGEIFITDGVNNRIIILDCNLLYQRKISHRTMTDPTDVKLTSEEVYALSYMDNLCVHVFSHSGDKIRSFIPRSDVGGHVSAAHFFCLDSSKNLIITDRNTNQVKIFSNEGVLLDVFNEYKPGVEIKAYIFHGVALINNQKLVVACYHEKFCLLIFSR